MSMELLPPDPKYPRRFHVRQNYCRCHPESCGCDDWAIYDPNGEKVTTFHNKNDADKYTMQLRRRMWASQLSTV